MRERGARQIVEVGDSPERIVAFQGEIEGELRDRRFGMQGVEQSNAVRHAADLNEILPGQAQNIRCREVCEC